MPRFPEPIEKMLVKPSHGSVCICTFRRPRLLANLLAKLREQVTENEFNFSVVVVDNDSARSAEPVVESYRKSVSWPIEYYVEPEQNIALARNRAVQHATGDWAAFIDDDEFPKPDWLLQLHRVLGRYGAAGVLAPVEPYFETPPPDWVLKGRMFERPVHPTGFVLNWTQSRTGNVMIKRSVLSDVPGPFRPECGSGGEDRDFFRRAMDRGHVFIWCQEAAVSEVIPPQRWQRSVLLRRALLRGKASLAEPSFGPGDLFKSAIAAGLYTAGLPIFFFCGQHIFMRFLIKNCDHVGKLLAACGINPVREKYVTC